MLDFYVIDLLHDSCLNHVQCKVPNVDNHFSNNIQNACLFQLQCDSIPTNLSKLSVKITTFEITAIYILVLISLIHYCVQLSIKTMKFSQQTGISSEFILFSVIHQPRIVINRILLNCHSFAQFYLISFDTKTFGQHRNCSNEQKLCTLPILQDFWLFTTSPCK